MKILLLLFCPPSGTWGSLTRILAIAEAAQKHNHEIALCASGPLLKHLTQLGYKTFPMPEATYFGMPKILSKVIGALSQRLTPPIKEGKSFGSMWFVYFLTGMSKYSYLKKLVAAELDAINTFKPDFLFTEVDPAAYLTAHITNIPIAITYSSILLSGIGSSHWKKLKNSYNKILERYQKLPIEPHDILLNNEVLKIVPSIPELENIKSDSNIIFIGSLQKSFALKADTFQLNKNKHYVFIYVGTGSISLHSLKKVLPEVAKLIPNTEFLVGSQSITQEMKIGNVHFRSYWNAEKIIPHCDWVICHGGHNTIIQSLINTVPLIIFPGPIFERRFNAEMVQKAGCGVFGEFSNFNAKWLCNVMSHHIQFAEKAKALGNKIIELGGAETAIKAIEQTRVRSL